MLHAIFRGIVRLLVGKSALESAERISRARQQQRRAEEAIKNLGDKVEIPDEQLQGSDGAAVSDERQALLDKARRTQAHVNATMDDETRKRVQETAARLMKEGK
jgi:hypothetical protein